MEFVLISGLSHSGTSLMMQILEIDCAALVTDPQPVHARIAEFLGKSFQTTRKPPRA